MYTCTIPLFLVLLILNTSDSLFVKLPSDHEWHLWKYQHNKNYTTLHEELDRHVTWLSNKAFIDAHNSHSKVFGFTLGMNQFGDMTDFEFQQKYSCVKPPDVSYNHTDIVRNKYKKLYQRPQNLTIPENVDWRSMGAVTSVKSQGKCCACYAFGALGALEGAHALAYGKLLDLSAQNILDCSRRFGNRGCRNGSAENTYMYIIENDGIDTTKSYPYIGEQSTCHFKKNGIGTTMRYYVHIETGSEYDLEAAVATQGPIAVIVDGSHNLFRFYKSGVLNIPNCSRTKVTQSLVAIGYGSINGKDYWIVKNSWGETWGTNGFGLMSRNKYNQCGIATHAIFPSL